MDVVKMNTASIEYEEEEWVVYLSGGIIVSYSFFNFSVQNTY